MRYWTIGVIVALSATMMSCVSSERYESAANDIEHQDEVIRGLENEIKELRRRDELSRNEAESLRLRLNAAQEKLAGYSDYGELRADLERIREELKKRGNSIPGVDVRETKDGTSFSVAGKLLFGTGNADLHGEGRQIITQVAQAISDSGRMIRVEGHTDNVPIVKLSKKYPLGNLQLSGLRALHVADYLINACDLDAQRVSYAGYGPEKPVADNATESGRAQNRRVEIILLK